jgi:hypothetical protein
MKGEISFSYLRSPAYIFSLFLLILNDAFLKSVFHNDITGKLSDFAGLFVFAGFWSCVFPKSKTTIHWMIAIVFVWWKSSLSEELIQILPQFHLPFNRVEDWTDCITISVLPMSLWLLKRRSHQSNFKARSIWNPVLAGVSLLAFVATTIPKKGEHHFSNINKEYRFPFSKRELVSRLNMVQIQEIHSHKRLRGYVNFDASRNVFYVRGSNDTLAQLLDYKKIQEDTLIRIRSSFAEMQIYGNADTFSVLKLVSFVKFSRRDLYYPFTGDTTASKISITSKFENRVIREFEKRIVRPIRKYRRTPVEESRNAAPYYRENY